MTRRIEVTAVEYLNAQPLWEGLRREPAVHLSLETPSRCAERLAEGSCDVALIPAVELYRGRGFRALGRGVVAATDRATSVLLLAPCPIDALEAVRTDPTSRTSNALAEILLRHRYGKDIPFLPPGVAAPVAAGRVGRVLIGDAALRPPPAATVLDLGQEWYEWTGLPFVFARWAVRGEAPASWSRILARARAFGLARRREMAARAAAETGMPFRKLSTYLERDLSYELRAPHRKSLERFAEHLALLGPAHRGAETAEALR